MPPRRASASGARLRGAWAFALAGLAATATWALLAAASAPAHRATEAGSSARLQVGLLEYRLLLPGSVVKAGPVDLQAIDRGTIAHDLRLQAVGSASGLAVPRLSPGGRWSGIVRLSAGVYRLWCSLPEHSRLGMHATLRVVR